MEKFFKTLLDIVYQPTCIVCGGDASNDNICGGCFSDIHLLHGEVTARIKKNCSRLFALAAYEGPLLTIVHRLKYDKGRAAVRVVSKLVKDQIDLPGDIDCVVPIPLSRGRYMKRSYNQAAIIAGMVAKKIGRPLFMRALIKTVKTEPQVGKDLSERRDNLKGAFSVPRFLAQPVRKKRVLLVDDVVTSGATIDVCAGVLLRAGAERVYALILAKTL